MSILDEISKLIKENSVDTIEATVDLEYNEDDGTYSVMRDDEEGAVIEFVNKKNDRTVDIDKAQLDTDNHIVYVYKISNKEISDIFVKKLSDMGFENISIEESTNESKEENKETLTETSNMDVIKIFVDDEFPHNKEEALEKGIQRWSPVWGSTNLKISKQNNGWALINYTTPLLFRDDEGKLLYNKQKYSATTSKIQNSIKTALEGVDFQEVDEEGMKNAIQ